MPNAKLRHSGASIVDADFCTRLRLDRALFQNYSTGRRIAEVRN